MLGKGPTDLDTVPPYRAPFSPEPNPSYWEWVLIWTRLPWVFVTGRALAAGLSLWSSLVPLSRGLALDHFSLIEHEVQAVADKLDDRKESGHSAAVEQRSEDAWREGLRRGEGEDAHACGLLPCFKPQRNSTVY